MSKGRPTRTYTIVRTIRKFFVSAFVIFSFVAYAVHERFGGSSGVANAIAPAQSPSMTQPVATQPVESTTPAQTALPAQPVEPTLVPTALPSPQTSTPPTATPVPAAPQAAVAPTQAPAPTAAAKGAYKDGEYTGDAADAYFGTVQVKAIIQNGKLADVQFLDYPNDRRTSIRINSVAVPDLTTEAIQAQSAKVDVVSGATLTSEAFVQSLQSALSAAKE
jgi:uncharacterized protein with FMN-binding domain